MPDDPLVGTRAVVTGASRGLGRSFATALAAAGASVVVNARDPAGVDAVVQTIRQAGGTAVAFPGSVADDGVADGLVAACVSELGGIDVLVNNAGIVRDRTLMKMTPDEFDDVMAVNVRGTWACGRAAAVAMKESGGAIINIVSNVAFHGSIGQSNYAASKAAVAGLTRAWAFELQRYGIRVNAVWPIADTDMTKVVIDRAAEAARAAGKPPPAPAAIGFGDPDDVAKLIVYLASPRAAHLNAQIVTFNGRRLALWTHPREVGVTTREEWSIDDLAATFGGPDALEQQPMYPPDLFG